MKKTLAYIENNLGSLIGYIESSLSELAAVGVETVPALWRRHVDHLLSLYREEQQQAPVALMCRRSGDPVWQESIRADRHTVEMHIPSSPSSSIQYDIWPINPDGVPVDPDWLDSFEEVRCDDCRGTGETPVNEPDHVCQCAGTGHMFRCPSCGHDHCPTDGSPPLQCDRCSAINEAEVWNRSEADDDLPVCGYCGRTGHDESETACPQRRQDVQKHITGGQVMYPRGPADQLIGAMNRAVEQLSRQVHDKIVYPNVPEVVNAAVDVVTQYFTRNFPGPWAYRGIRSR
jgi:hypothetical protein